MNDALISLSVPDHVHVISAHDLEEKMWFIIKKQTINVNQREKDLNIFYFTLLPNLHVNQGGKLTLKTDWNRTLLKPGSCTLNSASARSVNLQNLRKIPYLSGARRILWNHTFWAIYVKTKFCKKAVQKALSWQFMRDVLEFSPPALDTSNFLWNEQLTIILISGKMRSGF